MLVVADLGVQDVNALCLCVAVFLEVEEDVLQSGQLLIVVIANILLLGDQLLIVLVVLSQIEVAHILLTAGMPDIRQLIIGNADIFFSYGYLLEEAHLLVLAGHILMPGLVKLADQEVNLLTVLGDLV